MFDIAPTELLVCAVVALVVIGPKDLPKAMRVVGQFVAKMRGYASQFRSGMDNMMREAEMEELEKQWAEQNARIMADYPIIDAADAPPMQPLPDAAPAPADNPAPAPKSAPAKAPGSAGAAAKPPRARRKKMPPPA